METGRRAFLGTVAGVGVAGLGGCIATGSDLSASDYDVGMSSNAFLPDEYETAVGSTVVWGNTGSRAHTVTAYEATLPDGAAYFASGGFGGQAAAVDGWERMRGDDGGNLYSTETYSHTFSVPGTYRYYCIPHESQGMDGTILVREDPE